MNAYSPAPNLIVLSPAANAVIEACRVAGGRPLIVGGAVRDALLDGVRPTKDIDIEVHDLDDKAALIDALARVATVAEQGAAFEIIAVRRDGEDFDISLAPSVGAGVDRELAAFARRDFTINALGWDPVTQVLIDHASGRADAARGILRHTSGAFADDPLRVLRGVQFAGRFGFRFAAETKTECRMLAPRYHEIPTERVWGEWRKLARGATHWPEALAALDASGWAHHFAELTATRGVPQDPGWHAEGDVWTHLGLAARCAAVDAEREGLSGEDREVVVLATLLHDLGKVTHTRTDGPRITSSGHAEAGVAPAKALLRGIGAPRTVIDRVLPLVREHMAHVSVQGSPSRPAVRRLMRRLAPGGHGPTLDEWARVVDADCAGRGTSAKPSPSGRWLAIAATLGTASGRSILTGAHLVDRGFVPSAIFAEILRGAIAAQDDEVFTDEAGALGWLAEHWPPATSPNEGG